MRVAFVYAGGREARWKDAQAGRAPTDFFYGAVEVAKVGHEVTCLDAPDPKRSLFAAAYNSAFDSWTPVRTRGEQVVATARLLSRLRSVDAVVAASTAHANALAIWKRWGFLSAPLAGIHCGHVNYTLSGARLRSTSRLLRTQEIVLFADAERKETIRQFGLDPQRVHANPFGVDIHFWTPAEVPRRYILAVGNDGRRDYATFIKAAAGLSVPVKILTARPLPQPLPGGIEHLHGSWHAPAITDAQLRDLYRAALMVVVPLEDALQPSGQSVALQAMACGRPVILTRTRGLWIGEDFREGRDLILVPPNSPDALRIAMEEWIDDEALRERVAKAGYEATIRNGGIDRFAARLVAVLTAKSFN